MMALTHRTGSIALAATMIAFIPRLQGIPKPITDFIWLPQDASLPLAVCFTVSCCYGGLLPDADIPHSTAGKHLRFLLWPLYLFKKMLLILGFFIRPLKKIGTALGHRGLFHSPLFHTMIFAILSALFRGWSEWINCILSGLYFGVLSHLLLDLFSGGIPLFAPFSMKRQRPAITFKTGSFLEVIFNLVFVLVSIYMLYLTVMRRISIPPATGLSPVSLFY
ncbi:MAG: metal-dependent hydrolase [Lachnospiraceae bacterium]|nr:metal-dependent hydrolase [Lachnospiraceae bacterium]